MLKPINLATGKPEIEVQEPQRTCEACGKQLPSSQSINCIIVIGSPGHPSLAPFQCGHEEHWSCSPDCWQRVSIACINEHMRILLDHHRSKVGL